MNRRALLIMLSLFCCLSMIAHEFWIKPSRTRVQVGDRVALTLQVGENFTGEPWKGKGSRVNLYRHYFLESEKDMMLAIEPGDAIVDLPDFIPTHEGTHMIAFETDKAFIEMEAEKFEDYLKEDGLMHAYEYRVDNGERFKKGTEKYSRCAKVLIQAGEMADYTYKKKADLKLEIIPDKNPYGYDVEKGISFKVLYEGDPLDGATVKWWRRDGEKLERDELVTNHRGEVHFGTTKPGLYMISVVHMVRLVNDPDADWESTWSTLVFGDMN